MAVSTVPLTGSNAVLIAVATKLLQIPLPVACKASTAAFKSYKREETFCAKTKPSPSSMSA